MTRIAVSDRQFARIAAGSAGCDCLVCGGHLETSTLAGLQHCALCGFVTADAQSAPASPASMYGREYFHGGEYLDYRQEADALRSNFRRRMRTLESLHGTLRGKSVLEIGCAYGYFLEVAREYGMIARGVDVSAEGVGHARESLRVDAIEGDYLALDVAPMDLVVMWDTLEHLVRPDLYVEKAARDLRSGGLLAITTGDIGSANARLRGRRWRMIHPPTHFHYFSIATLARLLARTGFEIVHASHPGVSRELHSMLHGVVAQRMGAARLCAGLKVLLPNVPVTLNLFDIMFVVARKRG